MILGVAMWVLLQYFAIKMATSSDLYNDTVYKIQHPHWLELNTRPLTHGWHVAFAVVGTCVFIVSSVGNLTVILLFDM